MGQLLVRQLDDAAVMRLKMKARQQRTSAEALARHAIHREAAALTAEERLSLALRMQAITSAAMVEGVEQTPGSELIREDRDHGH